MSDSFQYRDPWRFPALALWILFFLVGLAPEQVYYWLRDLAVVLPQRALINSCHLLTLALACYVGLFSYHRCLDAGLSSRDAQDRGIQLTVLGLIAFLAVDFRLLLTVHENPIFEYRLVMYFVGVSKILAWWSLMALYIRYYAFGDSRAFAGVPSLFPSTRRRRKNECTNVVPQAPSAPEVPRAEEDSAIDRGED